MGRLTTHVLDTAHGRPAGGLAVTLHDARGRELRALTTDADGRGAAPLLEGAAFERSVYELRFAVGDYFAGLGVEPAADGPPFLDVVPVRFGVADPGEHYHVPLLVSPYGYSTYRGS